MSHFTQVVRYANSVSFPAIGDSAKLYVADDTLWLYFWDGSTYQTTGTPQIIDGQVATYADLPDPATHNGEIWLVTTTTGVILINRKVAGFYISNGTTWTLITPVDIDGYQKLIVSPTNGDIVTTDANGQTQDSGKTFSTDGTFAANSDNLIPTQKAVKTYADSKVENAINDGITDKAPSENAVYDALALKQNLSEKDSSDGYVGLTLLKINFKNVLNTFTSFFTNSNTASRTYTFQDRDGVIADNSDLALKADKSTAINTSSPLTGGGDLSQNRTIGIQDASITQKGATQLSNSYSGTSQTLATTEKALNDGLATKEPVIANGTIYQYLRGDKTWQTLDTSVVPENGNLYFTTARVLATALTNLIAAASYSVLAPTDTILQAFGKIKKLLDTTNSFDRWVDAVVGSDSFTTNSKLIPFATINKALTSAQFPLKIHLLGQSFTENLTLTSGQSNITIGSEFTASGGVQTELNGTIATSSSFTRLRLMNLTLNAGSSIPITLASGDLGRHVFENVIIQTTNSSLMSIPTNFQNWIDLIGVDISGSAASILALPTLVGTTATLNIKKLKGILNISAAANSGWTIYIDSDCVLNWIGGYNNTPVFYTGQPKIDASSIITANSGLASIVKSSSALATGLHIVNYAPTSTTWTASTAYVVDQFVSYLGVLYLCTTAHTSGASFDSAKFTNTNLTGIARGDIFYHSAAYINAILYPFAIAPSAVNLLTVGTYSKTSNGWQLVGSGAVWGSITGTLSNQTDLQTALNGKQSVFAQVASQAEMLALTGIVANYIVIRTDLGNSLWRLDALPATSINNWSQIASGKTSASDVWIDSAIGSDSYKTNNKLTPYATIAKGLAGNAKLNINGTFNENISLDSAKSNITIGDSLSANNGNITQINGGIITSSAFNKLNLLNIILNSGGANPVVFGNGDTGNHVFQNVKFQSTVLSIFSIPANFQNSISLVNCDISSITDATITLPSTTNTATLNVKGLKGTLNLVLPAGTGWTVNIDADSEVNFSGGYVANTKVNYLGEPKIDVLGVIATQAALDSLLASTSGTGLYVINFNAPTGITGLAKGDIIYHNVISVSPSVIQNVIRYPFAIATNTIYYSAIGTLSKTTSGWSSLQAVTYGTMGNATYNATGLEDVIVLTTDLTANRTLNLPSASAYPAGKKLEIVDATGSLRYYASGGSVVQRSIVVTPASGNTINKVANNLMYLEEPNAKLTLTSDGVSDWDYDPKLTQCTYAEFGQFDPDPRTAGNSITTHVLTGANSSYVNNDGTYVGNFMRVLTGASQQGGINFGVTRTVDKSSFHVEGKYYNNGTRMMAFVFFSTITNYNASTSYRVDSGTANGGYEVQLNPVSISAGIRILHNGTLLKTFSIVNQNVPWGNYVDFSPWSIKFCKGNWEIAIGESSMGFVGRWYDESWETRTLSGTNHHFWGWSDAGGGSATALMMLRFKNYIKAVGL